MASANTNMVKQFYLVNFSIYVGLIICFVVQATAVRTVSKIHVPYKSPPFTVITKISVAGHVPVLESLKDEAHSLFRVMDSGQIVTKTDLTPWLGSTFTYFLKDALESGPILDILHIKIDNSTNLFAFPQQQYIGTVAENLPSGSRVDITGHIWSQTDDYMHSNNVHYSIIQGNKNLFYLKHTAYSKTGEVKILTREPLDREERDEYVLVLQAKNDYGQIAQAAVKIFVLDENDNSPKFERHLYSCSVRSDSKCATKLVQVHAHDPDFDVVRYKITKQNDLFKIDATNGWISVCPTQNAILRAGNYKLKVVAQDLFGQKSVPSSVLIKVYDLQVLKFESFDTLSQNGVKHRSKRTTIIRQEKTHTVAENYPTTQALFSIASDPPPTMGSEQYTLQQSSVENLVTVNTRGNVYLVQGKKLDYEDKSQRLITMLFYRTNTNTPNVHTEVKVTLYVTDVNDEKPVFVNQPQPFLATVSTNPSVGELVYELMAEDPDSDSDIKYILESAGERKFAIQNKKVNGRNVGKIVTAVSGNGQFEKGQRFELVVSARDMSARGPGVQKSDLKIVDVLVGNRPPQFFQDPYIAYVMENNQAGYILQTKEGRNLKVQAKPFQSRTSTGAIKYDRSVSFLIFNERGQPSSLFAINELGEVETLQSMDYEATPYRTSTLIINGTEETTGLTQSTRLIVNLVDDNDNTPVFGLSTYTSSISEGTPLGAVLFSVTATDRDSNENANLTYAVTDDHFEVDTRYNPSSKRYIGDLKVKRKLDYDFRPERLYKFNITATDAGNDPRVGWASVVIYVTNINDEKPRFGTAMDDIYASIREDQVEGSYVTMIQAVDPDGDNVEYFFTERRETAPNGPFRIDPSSGIITLTEKIPPAIPKYVLNITAYDDGSCCGKQITQKQESYRIIEIKDINNNNPSFPNCNYQPIVMENQAVGTEVVKVLAEDNDRGPNGQITYSVITPSFQTKYFDINPEKGILVTKFVFDRESDKGLRGYPVTVKAEDQGKPQQLNSLCTFWVRIDDENDNRPVFDSLSYEATITRSFDVHKRVTGVLATDLDKGRNAEVKYRLSSNPGNYFRIEEDTGSIYLDKPIVDLSYDQDQILLNVMATDRGLKPLNSTVRVTIKLTMNQSHVPTWDSDYDGRVYEVEETRIPGDLIGTFSATSNNPNPLYQGVSFALIKSDGSQVQFDDTFSISTTARKVKLKLRGILDYNVKNLYTVRLRVTNKGNNPASNEIRITIKVKDMNNEPPRFEGLDPNFSNTYKGSVPENEPVGQPVITVNAVDGDHDPPNNEVTYHIVEDRFGVHKLFDIDPITGLIRTNFTFDRESNDLYYIDIMVKDGKASDVRDHEPPNTPNSATAQVMVVIADKNDNSPEFERPLYSKNVQEQAPDSSRAILKVTAHDQDDADILTYTITSGNIDNVFGIKPKTGEIYVAQDLDYETPPKVYNLTVTVSDGYHTNTTRVVMTVMDINDNQPEFTQLEYVITSVVEEIDPPAGQEKFLIQVSATDKDIDRPRNFRYSLNTDHKDSSSPTFSIGPKDGRIYLKKSLDRDQPRGRAEYQFNIIVDDEPGSGQSLRGYAYVKVKPKDINDNAPLFIGNLTGDIPENSAPGKNIMTVRAVDYDLGLNGTVFYEIDGHSNIPSDHRTGQHLFEIHRNSGLLSSNTAILDREVLDHYYLQIVAYDKGTPQKSSTATLTIQVTDENDEAPVFLQKIYRVTLSEAQLSGPVITVSATDDDIGDNAKLSYTLESDLSFFSVTILPSNAGVINVHNRVDYEDPNQRFFNLTVTARDSNPRHEDHAFVEITVTDANDEAPKFSETVKIFNFDENIPEGTLLHTFTAVDNDSPPNNEFVFAIGEYSDRFYVEQRGNQGLVKIQRGLDGETLDRETSSKYTVEVLAIDKGSPPLTGTATLIINVRDLNDEAPTFARNYRPIVMEDEPFPNPVITFTAIDRDSKKHGPPFKFYLPPCVDNPTCDPSGHLNFTLEFHPAGNGRNESGTITAMNRFFREQQKYYYLPVVMADMGGNPRHSMVGTSTLTIEIGDKNNNQHVDGTKNIFVYNYKGMFGNVNIGRANAEDPDDWDFVDKWYYFVGPENMKRFFNVSKINGTITMNKGVPAGFYEFKVLVHDFKVFRSRNATATIHVEVQEISEEAVFNSGSIRLTGITAEEFLEIRPGGSHYFRVRQLLSQKLRVPLKNVAIFSVMNNGGFLDIRVSAHGSPWYSASKLDGIITMYRNEFQVLSGGTIMMVNIDECLKEVCESGGCSNILVVDESHPNLVNTKGKSFVGVSTKIKADCQCKARDFTKPMECYPGYCHNGGTCMKDNWGEINCTCLQGFDGKRCQKTRHSFTGGFTLYQPLSQCEDSTTSIEFVTTEDSGLIFYNGPVDELTSAIPRDFIALELIKGYPRLQIDHGTGQVSLEIDGKDAQGITRMNKLNDGRWHHIDIIRKGKDVTMIVDRCNAAEFEFASESRDDRLPCEVSKSTRGRSKYLNVNTMLQMGGRYTAPSYPPDITDAKFHGCIRNFIHNGELYDLYTSRNHPGVNHENDCPQEDRACLDERGRSKCGRQAKCEISNWNSNDDIKCTCKPGWRPRYINSKACDTMTTIRDLKNQGFMTWILKNRMYNILNDRSMTVHMSFRTRNPNGGILLHLSSSSKEYITLEIVDDHLQVTYNLKNYDAPMLPNTLSLPAVPANNGQWHHVTFNRIGKWLELKMDSGEGRYQNETWGSPLESQKFTLRHDEIVAGARVMFEATPVYNGRGLSDTCITDIRIDNMWFPMRLEENSHSPAANLSLYPNVAMGCKRNDCAGVRCAKGVPISRVCVPLWDDKECRCPKGSVPGKDQNCIPIQYCKPNPCYSGGTCISLDFPNTFICSCPPGWAGQLCNQQAQSTTVPGGVTTEALVIIIVSIFAVALIVLLVFLLVRNFSIFSKWEREKSILYDDQYDDVRENVMDHDEEGAGEEDQAGYDISRLRKPDMYMDTPFLPETAMRYGKAVPPGDVPEVGGFINDRLQEADEDDTAPPHDNVMEFAYEGGDSETGSLSSLHTSSSGGDQEYDYLSDWGPKFTKLAHMYGGQPLDSENV